MDEPEGYYAKWNKLVTGKMLHNFTYMRYISSQIYKAETTTVNKGWEMGSCLIDIVSVT